MNVSQATYRKCLEAVAPREVWAARENGTYAATWNHQGNQNRTPTDMQRQVMAMLDKHGELTTSQIRSRLGTNKAITENVMRGMHSKRLAVSEKRQIEGITQLFWRLVE